MPKATAKFSDFASCLVGVLGEVGSWSKVWLVEAESQENDALYNFIFASLLDETQQLFFWLFVTTEGPP